VYFSEQENFEEEKQVMIQMSYIFAKATTIEI